MLNFPKLSFYPPQLEICLSEKCNLDCDYCFINKSCKGKLIFSSIQKGIEIFFNTSQKRKLVSFNSGEPLIHFNLLQKTIDCLIKKANNKNVHLDIILTTNGILLDKKKLKFLSSKKDKIILNLSLDGRKKVMTCIVRLGAKFSNLVLILYGTTYAILIIFLKKIYELFLLLLPKLFLIFLVI